MTSAASLPTCPTCEASTQASTYRIPMVPLVRPAEYTSAQQRLFGWSCGRRQDHVALAVPLIMQCLSSGRRTVY